MDATELQRKMRSAQWNANKRTMKKKALVKAEIIEEAQKAQSGGNFDQAVALFEGVDADAVNRDYSALMMLGLAHYGLGQMDIALKHFDQADQVAREQRARALVNKANILKVMGDYEGATEAALQAIELAPDFSAAHLMMFAIIENQRPNNRADMLTQSVAQMKQVWSGWEQDTEFWNYLLTDVDYFKLRESGELSNLFGEPPATFEEERSK